jgi:Fur family transcriptional regulator, ferric uptake regulator
MYRTRQVHIRDLCPRLLTSFVILNVQRRAIYGLDTETQQTQRINRELIARGHRLTPRRLRVVEVLARHEGHMTGDDILYAVQDRYPSTNKTTVYRTLDLLSALGMVAVTDLGGGKLEYELVREPHHHLICSRCGHQTEVEDHFFEPLRRSLMERYGYQTNLDHFALFGICPHCRPQTPGSP